MSEDLVDEIVMKPKKKSKKSVLQNDAVQFTEILSKRGVIYIARIPPFMKPNKMRNIFEEFGEVTRLFLAEEDIEMKKKRKESGGNSSKQFHEGWIEYADKKTARQVAESLNNTSIGGKKSSYYHDDIWNVKYLKGFKWEHLTEKVAYERRVRENKLKASLQVSKRQNAEFMELVDKAKTDKYIGERKKKREAESLTEPDEPVKKRSKFTAFNQVKPIAKNYGETKLSVVGKKTLRNIFGTSGQ